MARRGNFVPVIATLGALIVLAALFLWFQRPSANTAIVAPPPAAAIAVATIPAPAPLAPSFDVVRLDAKGGLVMAGRAAPDAEVVILDGDREIGRIKANHNGEWVFAPDADLAPGRHDLQLRATAPDGTTLMSLAPVTMVVPDQAGSTPLVVKHLPDGSSMVLLGPPILGGAGTISIDAVDYSARQLSASGKAIAGATVRLYLDNQPMGSATADAAGLWRLPPHTIALAAGRHCLRGDQLGPDGKVAARVEVAFASGAGHEPAASITVEAGNSLWRIARDRYGQGTAYTLIYQSNHANIRDPNLIYPGQVFSLPEH